MRTLVLILTALFLTACAPEGGSPSAKLTVAPDGTIIAQDPVYTMRIHGNNATFGCLFWSNFGDADQVELATNLQAVASGLPVDYEIQGRNTVGNCAHHSGAGVLTVEIFKDGQLVSTKTSNGTGTSAFWNIDIE